MAASYQEHKVGYSLARIASKITTSAPQIAKAAGWVPEIRSNKGECISKEALKNPSHDPWSPDAAMALSCLRRGNGGSSEPPKIPDPTDLMTREALRQLACL
jgi:hypothetical protein